MTRVVAALYIDYKMPCVYAQPMQLNPGVTLNSLNTEMIDGYSPFNHLSILESIAQHFANGGDKSNNNLARLSGR